jgi:hypothetical protein
MNPKDKTPTDNAAKEIEEFRRLFRHCMATVDGDNLADALLAIAHAICGLRDAVYDVSHTLATPEVGDALQGLASFQHVEPTLADWLDMNIDRILETIGKAQR